MFYGPDGKPMSAAQFVERLYGELPALFKNEDELRALWSEPETSQKVAGGSRGSGASGNPNSMRSIA